MNEVTPPPPEAPKGPVDNWAQAKAAIDSGATGDKVTAGDPAAAPLGTDAEAGGSRTTPEHHQMNAAAETQAAAHDTRSADLTENVKPKTSAGLGLIIGIVAALVLAAILGWLVMHR